MKTTEDKLTNVSIKMGTEIKEKLNKTARAKGMDLSKLARAILTNYVEPNTFSL